MKKLRFREDKIYLQTHKDTKYRSYFKPRPSSKAWGFEYIILILIAYFETFTEHVQQCKYYKGLNVIEHAFCLQETF